ATEIAQAAHAGRRDGHGRFKYVRRRHSENWWPRERRFREEAPRLRQSKRNGLAPGRGFCGTFVPPGRPARFARGTGGSNPLSSSGESVSVSLPELLSRVERSSVGS